MLKPFEKSTCYYFSLDLAFFPQATFVGSFGEVIIYDTPVTLDIWGGNADCEKAVLLHRTAPIAHEDWRTYDFSVTPDKQFTHMVLEAGYASAQKTYGNVLVDNMMIESLAVDLGPDIISCAGASVHLNVSAPGSVLWSTGSTETPLTVNSNGTYSVIVEKGACSTTDQVHVQFLEPLQLDLGSDTTICPGDALIYDVSTTRGTYQWSPGLPSPTAKILSAGTYHVSVSNGCENVEDEIVVQVDYVQCCNLSAPNIFTPNDDDLNEYFEISSPSDLQRFDLTIYNRWGRIVFQSTERANFWDGITEDGNDAASGIYYWIASIGCTHEEEIFNNTYRGTLTLLR